MTLLAVDFENFHQILKNLYDDMIPLCSDMAGVAKGVAGLGALFFIALKVWGHLSRAEPIDVYPLLRPFALGICIMIFPLVLGTMNTVLSPIVRGTNGILEGQTFDMEQYRAQKDKLEYEAKLRNPETAFLVSDEVFDKQLDDLGWSPSDLITMMGMYMERIKYSAEQSIRDAFRSLLEILFQAASLVIDTIRTFYLVVLAILGPIVFALSCYPGFENSLSTWFTRYIQTYLWLPVADLFSSVIARIQVLMLKADIDQLNDPSFIPDSSNTVYIIFMLISIVGYFTIPTVAGWIVSAGSMGGLSKNMQRGASLAGGAAGAAAGNIAGRLMK